MFRDRSNCSVIWVPPRELDEFIESSPAIVENSRSSGVATDAAMVSGFAPGSCAETRMVGKSTFGRALTGSLLYASTPNATMAIITSVVATGRRMNRLEMFNPAPRNGVWPGDPPARTRRAARCSRARWATPS